MDIYTATELAYNNGYEKGYNDGVSTVRGVAKWIISSDGYYPYCSNCKTDPGGGRLSKFCPECGFSMIGDNDES